MPAARAEPVYSARVRGFEEVAAFVRANEVGRRVFIDTPFGRRLVCYADSTATGRYLHFIEAWIRRVRPFYANTHTAVSSTGRMMTSLREKARQVIHRAVGADPDDEVLFTGAGATCAVNKLVGLLGLRIDELFAYSVGADTVEEADREALREAGFSDRDIWDISATASFFNMSNRMAAAVDMRPNGEYHAMAR